MASRSLLRLTNNLSRVPSRGMAALKNWKRPSMDELPAPTEPWGQVYAKRQARYNTILAGGLAVLIGTIAFAKVSGIIQFYGTPWHIINKKN